MRSAAWWTVSIVSFIIAVAFFVRALWLKDWLDTADKASSVVSGFLGVISLAVAAASLNEAAEELALLVDRQWTREAGIRGLLHPDPQRVT